MEIWFEAFVGSLGKLWRQNRRKLPPGIRGAFAQLLLEVRVEFLPANFLDVQSNIGRARYDVRGITELLKRIAIRQGPSMQDSGSHYTTPRKVTRLEEHIAGDLVGAWAPIPDQSAHVDHNRRLEVRTLKRDICDLEAEIARMTVNHQSQMSNLRRKLDVSAEVMQQSMTTLTEQVAAQASCLTKVFRTSGVIPNDAPV